MDNLTGSVNVSMAIMDSGSVYSIVLPVVWSLLVLTGTIGNGLVIYTLGKNGEMTATNCYVVNLALADLMFLLVVVPFTTVAYAFHHWIFGESFCKTANFMIYVSTFMFVVFSLRMFEIGKFLGGCVVATILMAVFTRRTTGDGGQNQISPENAGDMKIQTTTFRSIIALPKYMKA